MTGVSRLVVGISLALAVALAAPASAAELAEGTPPAAESVVSPGRLLGVVTDAAGAPLEEVLISATGPAGATLAVCDADGRFEFRALPPGTYLLRAHIAGFTAVERHVVEVKSEAATVHAVMLRRAAREAPAPAFLAAGFGGVSGVVSGSAEPESGSVVQPDTLGEPDFGPAERHVVAPHDDSDKAWWLRRARRSVLKDTAIAVSVPDLPSASPEGFQQALAADGGRMSEVPTPFPVSGQFHLLTRASIHSPSELQSSDILPGQIAYVSLGGPQQNGPWGFQGAVRTGDAGSFVLAGSYVAETSDTHGLALGASYSRQHLTAASAGVVTLVSSAAASVPDPSREVGSVSINGAWAVAPQLDFDYGVDVAKYGYLDEAQVFSPHAVFTMMPMRRTRVRLAVSQYMLAPGAEEFLPPSQGVWLPPERTFAPLSPGEPLRAERTQHFEAAVERDFGQSGTVAVREPSEQLLRFL